MIPDHRYLQAENNGGSEFETNIELETPDIATLVERPPLSSESHENIGMLDYTSKLFAPSVEPLDLGTCGPSTFDEIALPSHIMEDEPIGRKVSVLRGRQSEPVEDMARC